MDKTYHYLYEELYKHFYRFCMTGNMSSKDAIDQMKGDVENTNDPDLMNIYQIVQCMDPLDRTRFQPKVTKFEKSLAADDYENRWRLYSLLYLTYQYIYPDSVKAEKVKMMMDTVEGELEKAGVSGFKIEFEETDYAIRMHIKKNIVINDAYGPAFSKRDFRLQNRSFMTILKGFSSSTPFFYPALRERFHNVPIKGGGFFLKWKGYGIVVDPGINFMENMHFTGLNINDINAVFVTHDHIDHNGDLPAIDDLASQFGRRDIALYMDKHTEREYAGRKGYFSEKNRHGIDLTMNRSFDIGPSGSIQVEVMPTKHILENEKRKKKNYLENITYALKLSLKDAGSIRSVIGFTSDSMYLDGFTDFFKECDYIVANISETGEADYQKIKLKDKHLGYYGCLRLIREQCAAGRTPKFILSEFWAGKGDVRMELIRALRRETGYDCIYPGDIGMMFFLDQPTFLCSYCGKEESLIKLNIIKKGIEYARLENVCSGCILS